MPLNNNLNTKHVIDKLIRKTTINVCGQHSRMITLF